MKTAKEIVFTKPEYNGVPETVIGVFNDFDLSTCERYIGKAGNLTFKVQVNETVKDVINDIASWQGHTIVYVYRNHRPVWGGILLSAEESFESTGHNVEFNGITFEGYFNYRCMYDDEKLNQIDPAWLVRRFAYDVDHDNIGGGQYSNINIATGTEVLGQHFNYGWKMSDKKYMSECIDELSKLGNGFEWMITLQMNPNNQRIPYKRLVFGFPKFNNPYPYFAEQNSNLVSYKQKYDVTNSFTSVATVGSVPDDAPSDTPIPVSKVYNIPTPGGDRGYLRLEKFIDKNGVTTVDALNTWAKQYADTIGGVRQSIDAVIVENDWREEYLGSMITFRVNNIFNNNNGRPVTIPDARIIGYTLGNDDTVGLTVERKWDGIDDGSSI